MERYYKVLEVRSDASAEEIRQSYHDLIRVWNPDRFSDDKRLQEKAKRKLNEIISAYTAIVTSKAEFKPETSTADSSKALHYSNPLRPVVVAKRSRKSADEERRAAGDSGDPMVFASKMLRTMLVAFLIAVPASLYFFVTRGGFAAIGSFIVILVVIIGFMLKRK